jgi:arylsulfatase A-like enzyme
MARRLPTLGLALLAAAVAILAAGACTGKKSVPARAEPRLTRLLPALGPVEFIQFDEETRPATRLYAGEVRRCRLEVPAGARLHFSFGIPKEAPAGRWLLFRVRADGQEIYRDRISGQRRDHWFHAEATLPRGGFVSLEFEGTWGAKDVPAPGAKREPELALGSPRLYAPGERSAPRLLVWVSQDTVRADHLSAYGYPRRTSPTLESLAADAVLFENGVSAASWTLPSMASQMTSRLPTRHGATLQDIGRDLSKRTVFEVLADEGFTVLGVTGNKFVSAAFSTAQGFDALWYTALRADDVNRLALSLLEEWEGGDLAVFVHYMDPHFGYDPPSPFHRMFADPAYRGTQKGFGFGSLTRERNPADVDQVIALYDGELAFADSQIRRFLDALPEQAPARDVVLVYSADHGEEFLEHGHWGHGRHLHQDQVHVPFVIGAPGARARRVKDPVSLVDVAPTVLDAFGITAPESFEGRSLMPVLEGGPIPARPLLSETELTRDGTHRVAIREGSVKYLLAVPRRGEPLRVVSEELYRLDQDPREQRNLAPSPEAERLRRAALAYLERARAEAAPPNPAVLTPEALEKLKALGYIE